MKKIITKAVCLLCAGALYFVARWVYFNGQNIWWLGLCVALLAAKDVPLRRCMKALLACGLPAFEAAACAVYLHGAAADRAAARYGEYGMLPHDLLPELGTLFAEHER